MLDQCHLPATSGSSFETVAFESLVQFDLDGIKGNHRFFPRWPDPDPFHASNLGKRIQQGVKGFQFTQTAVSNAIWRSNNGGQAKPRFTWPPLNTVSLLAF